MRSLGEISSLSGEEKNQYTPRFLILLAMLYAIILAVCGLYTYRPVIVFGATFSVSSLIYPISYVISDIICEVYGYNNARRLIWFGLIACFTFAFITMLMDSLPYPASYKHTAEAYVAVLHPYMRLTFSGLCSMFIGEFMNAIIISKWRILLKGKWFWLRSIGSTAIGSAVDTAIEYTVAFSGLVSLHTFLKWLFFAYLFRILYAAIMGVPATFIVSILRKIDGANKEIDTVKSYNPFAVSKN